MALVGQDRRRVMALPEQPGVRMGLLACVSLLRGLPFLLAWALRPPPPPLASPLRPSLGTKLL